MEAAMKWAIFEYRPSDPAHSGFLYLSRSPNPEESGMSVLAEGLTKEGAKALMRVIAASRGATRRDTTETIWRLP